MFHSKNQRIFHSVGVLVNFQSMGGVKFSSVVSGFEMDFFEFISVSQTKTKKRSFNDRLATESRKKLLLKPGLTSSEVQHTGRFSVDFSVYFLLTHRMLFYLACSMALL